MSKLRACWAILRGRAVIYQTEIRYGEVDLYGRPRPMLAGRSLIESCRVTVHPNQRPEPKRNRVEGSEAHA